MKSISTLLISGHDFNKKIIPRDREARILSYLSLGMIFLFSKRGVNWSKVEYTNRTLTMLTVLVFTCDVGTGSYFFFWNRTLVHVSISARPIDYRTSDNRVAHPEVLSPGCLRSFHSHAHRFIGSFHNRTLIHVVDSSRPILLLTIVHLTVE
jgi:hypothetical protein